MSAGSVTLGSPHVPIVPVAHFDKIPTKYLEEVWPIIGPSVAYNIESMPLWKVIAAAYCEGLNHGSAIGKENTTKG